MKNERANMFPYTINCLKQTNEIPKLERTQLTHQIYSTNNYCLMDRAKFKLCA